MIDFLSNKHNQDIIFLLDFSESMTINSRKEYALIAILKVWSDKSYIDSRIISRFLITISKMMTEWALLNLIKTATFCSDSLKKERTRKYLKKLLMTNYMNSRLLII